jgi:hypothetical protein
MFCLKNNSEELPSEESHERREPNYCFTVMCENEGVRNTQFMRTFKKVPVNLNCFSLL